MPLEQDLVTGKVGLSKEQKIGFLLLLVFAIISISLGALKIRNGLYAPFALNNKVPATLKDEINGVDSLRFRDTDNDALNDFEELYAYGTSPYLYDTFGYGMSDKEVIAKGLPLCPKGQDCSGGVANQTESSNTVMVSVPDPGQMPTDLTTILSDPAQLRKMLEESGMDKTVLKKITDKELLLMLDQIMATNSSTLEGLKSITNIVN